MPVLSIADSTLLYVSTLKVVDVGAIPPGRFPLPVARLMSQVTSDRLALAGEQLRAGDELITGGQFRSAISRHYYAMYHAARAITYAHHGGDDHEQHSRLPRHLPATWHDLLLREGQLSDARLLRNQADYDPYPSSLNEWEAEARTLGATASGFVSASEDFALMNGYV